MSIQDNRSIQDRDTIAKCMPDSLYPCSRCSEKDGGYDYVYYNSKDLVVLGGKLFCEMCVRHAESLYNLIYHHEWEPNDLKPSESDALDSLDEPMYFCRSCQDISDGMYPVFHMKDLTWYEGGGRESMGFYCGECLNYSWIEKGRIGPSLTDMVQWEAKQRAESIKIRKADLRKDMKKGGRVGTGMD